MQGYIESTEPMTSPHLKAERERLISQIGAVRSSGETAPPGVRIEPDFLSPKTWMLSHINLPMKERKLGHSGSAEYRQWAAKIQRRDDLAELEKQLELLQGLIDCQEQSDIVHAQETPSIDSGDLVEFEGHHYHVEDVGFKYLKLVGSDGKVIRCAVEQAKLLSKSGEACLLQA